MVIGLGPFLVMLALIDVYMEEITKAGATSFSVMVFIFDFGPSKW